MRVGFVSSVTCSDQGVEHTERARNASVTMHERRMGRVLLYSQCALWNAVRRPERQTVASRPLRSDLARVYRGCRRRCQRPGLPSDIGGNCTHALDTPGPRSRRLASLYSLLTASRTVSGAYHSRCRDGARTRDPMCTNGRARAHTHAGGRGTGGGSHRARERSLSAIKRKCQTREPTVVTRWTSQP